MVAERSRASFEGLREFDSVPFRGAFAPSLDGTFLTASLLTGTPSRAEAAMVECLGDLTLQDMVPDALFACAASAAIQLRPDLPYPSEDAAEEPWSLPIELRRVCYLPAALRQSFVLRILVGWPRERCARVLRREGLQIDEDGCTAARALARVGEKEKAARGRRGRRDPDHRAFGALLRPGGRGVDRDVPDREERRARPFRPAGESIAWREPQARKRAGQPVDRRA